MSRPESGCAACSSTSHTVASCETKEAAEHYRRLAAEARAKVNEEGFVPNRQMWRDNAERYRRKAAAIERRLSGAQAPVTQGSPRLQGRAAFVKEPKNEKPFDMAPIDDDLAELERIAPLEGRKHNSRGRATR